MGASSLSQQVERPPTLPLAQEGAPMGGMPVGDMAGDPSMEGMPMGGATNHPSMGSMPVAATWERSGQRTAPAAPAVDAMGRGLQ